MIERDTWITLTLKRKENSNNTSRREDLAVEGDETKPRQKAQAEKQQKQGRNLRNFVSQCVAGAATCKKKKEDPGLNPREGVEVIENDLPEETPLSLIGVASLTGVASPRTGEAEVE